MPTWLVHGFRWPRPQIRIHTILQNLDDVAPEWLMAPATSACLLENFKKEYPKEMAQLPDLCFIEQYDPEDLTVKDQPYAYVCDRMYEVKLGVDIDDVRGDGPKDAQWEAISELRDKVASGEKLGWFVVVNGDVERWAPPLDEDEEDLQEEEEEEEEDEVEEEQEESQEERLEEEQKQKQIQIQEQKQKHEQKQEQEREHEVVEISTFAPDSQSSSSVVTPNARSQEQERPSTSKSFKNWFGGKLKKARSFKDLKGETIRKEPPPPLPSMSPSAALQPPKTANGKRPTQSEHKSMSFRTRWLSSEKNAVST